MESSVSPKLLLLALTLLLVFAQLQARELGRSTQAQHGGGGGLPSVLVLPSGGGGDDDDDGAAVVPPKLNAVPGVSRPGGLAPPAPQPGYRPQPGREPSLDVVSSPGVTGNQKHAPPSPAGNPPPHYRRLGPAADLLRVVWDALLRLSRSLC